MNLYPLRFRPIYKDKIWGGRNLERLYSRPLPLNEKIGESWELADLEEGTSVVANGPLSGTTLTELTAQNTSELLGFGKGLENGRFPLLLKLLDANDMLSLQVHPDERAVKELGGSAALKTECWYIVESRGGFIYKGVKPGVTPDQFRKAIENDSVADLCLRFDVADGDFHYLPAGTVHALGAGVVVAEVQTPSDTTYRVSDWGRGRQLHIEESLKCIHFEPPAEPPGQTDVNTLLVTDYFSVMRHTAGRHEPKSLPSGECSAMMILSADELVEIHHRGEDEQVVRCKVGDTVLLPASLQEPLIVSAGRCDWLQVTLPKQAAASQVDSSQEFARRERR